MAHESTKEAPTGYSRRQYIVAIGLIVAVCIAISLYQRSPVVVAEPEYYDDETTQSDVSRHITSIPDPHVQPDPLFQPLATGRGIAN